MVNAVDNLFVDFVKLLVGEFVCSLAVALAELLKVGIDSCAYDNLTLAVFVSKNKAFDGWDKWKKLNKDGFDCHVNLKREGKVITVFTENGGILVKSTTTIRTDDDKVYVALTGDQCALTNINFNPKP